MGLAQALGEGFSRELAIAAARSAGGLALIEVEPGLRFRYLEANDAFLRVVPISRDELLGRHLDELLDAADADARALLWGEVVRSGTPVSYVRPIALSAGSRSFETTVSPVANASGVVTQLVQSIRDVTERVRAREAADRFEARFEALQEYASDGFVLIGAEGHITYASEGCASLLGYQPTDLVGSANGAIDFFHPDDVATVRASWTAALEDPGSAKSLEVRVRHRSGSWIECDGRMVSKLDTATIEAVVVTFSDVTGHRQAERDAARSNTRLEEILRSAFDAIVNVDENQVIATFNVAAGEMFGYAAAEIIGQPLDELIPERFRNIHEHHVADFREGPVGRRSMGGRAGLLGRRKDGSEFPIEVTISRVRYADSVWFTAIIRDVTERHAAESAARDAAARQRALIANSSESVSIIDRQGRIKWRSPAIERLLGYRAALPVDRELSIWGAVHPEDRQRFGDLILASERQSPAPVDFEVRAVHADGAMRWFAGTLTDLTDDPAVAGIVLNAHDITRTRALIAQQAMLAMLGQRAISELTLGATIATTVAGVREVLDVDLTLHAQQLPTGDRLRVLATAGSIDVTREAFAIGTGSHWDRAMTSPTMSASLNEDPTNAEDVVLLAAGAAAGIAAGISCKSQPFGVLGAYSTSPREFTFDEVQFLRSAANLLTSAIDRRQHERDLRHQSLHDALTGLPNRMLLEDRLQQALNARERTDGSVAVLLIDLDDFKVVNDTLGHSAGDALLRAVATRLEGAIRPEDTLARFGGDEFVVIVRHDAQTVDTAISVVERIQAALQEAFEVTPDHKMIVSASIGITLAPTADLVVHPAILISEADLAMYRAKRRGGDTYAVFDEGFRIHVQARLDLTLGIRDALERDEFQILYQPEVDLLTGRVVDVEALVRWQHPHEGLLAPDVFLATAEETGLIIPIGRAVVEKACSQAASWEQTLGARAPQHIWVNISPRELLHPDLLPTIGRALDQVGLDPSRLGIEITEHVFIDDLDDAADILRRLHENGHPLCLDDFGTGYSSLTYLQRLPFDHLKIDKSFVDRLDHDASANRSNGIVHAIITMAHELGLVVTAEGIEHPSQSATLSALGCDRGQGYLFARPALAHELFACDPAGR